jgi:hypothetical protein
MGSSVFMETAMESALNSCAKGGLANDDFSVFGFIVEEVVAVVAVVAEVDVDVDDGIDFESLLGEYKLRKAMNPMGGFRSHRPM